MLQIRNLTKTYKVGSGRIVALDNVNIDFPEKGLVFIVGKSGSGKSTFLNILGGLDQMDSGDIIIGGRSTSDFSKKDFDAYRNYHIGFIFQEFNLIEDISVKENIAIALKIQSKSHDETTIDEALKMVNLEGLGYRTPKELSGGQKQRISVARALVKNPNIILADEPTGALDSKTGYELMSSLKTLSKDKLVIVVTHDFEMANIFGDEIIKLIDGRIVDHLTISNDYVVSKNERISNKILKITSGNEIIDVDFIKEALDKDSTNYVCLTSTPESFTVAYPETYSKIFTKEDLSKKFVSKKGQLSELKTVKHNDSKQKARIEFKECFKMALQHFKTSKGRFLFLLIFTIISFSMLGLTYTLSNVDNNRIIANTLSNNDIELGVMERYSSNGKENFNLVDVNSLKTKYDDNNFAIGKTISLTYTPSSKPSGSAFEMGEFKGIVECSDISELNLNILEGKAKFDDYSLANNEIIISDYAAYELRRTGYLGRDADGIYGVVKPSTLSEQINTKVLINTTEYKIVGVFDTNFEDYLPLLISEVYVNDEESQASSLEALKSYYYARVFGPSGFYKKYIDTSGHDVAPTYFSIFADRIPLHNYNVENEAIESSYIYTNLMANQLKNFYSFEEVIQDSTFKYKKIWGEVPDKLKDNQVILSYDWLYENGFIYEGQIEAAVKHFNSNLIVRKMYNSNTVDTIVYDKGVEVVAVIDVGDNISIGGSQFDFYSSVPIYLSSSYEEMFESSIYSYDQILFTLSGSKASYTSTIKNFSNDGFSVLNIDGKTSFGEQELSSLKNVVMFISIVFSIFSLLILFNYSLNNIKARKKEIGILRATGARGKDILKIFLVEEGILAFIVSLFSLIIVGVASSYINKSIGNMDIGIQLVVFNIIDALVIILLVFIIYAIATLIPVISVANMKPIDAIRKN